MSFFSDEQIAKLLRYQVIDADWALSELSHEQIEAHIRSIVDDVCQKYRLQDKSEFDHYGSGYASYIDCWLYRPGREFAIGPDDSYAGLVVLFSRLSSFYVLGEGAKSWWDRGSSSYLPDFDLVDNFEHQCVQDLVPDVTACLLEHGFKRLYKADLESYLPEPINLHSMLTDLPLRHFDALFNWMD